MNHGYGPRVYEALPGTAPGRTIRELLEVLDADVPAPGTSAVRRHLANLDRLGLIDYTVGPRGARRYWRLTESIHDAPTGPQDPTLGSGWSA